MRVLVDEIPDHPDLCPFSDFVHAVDSELLNELVEDGEVEVCDDCGGVNVDTIGDEYIQEVYVCQITQSQCGMDKDGECDGLCLGYVTKF